ncbi:MAG: hypothetical protein HYV97_19190 [Bdellovibrio sp.]|nr:hypothetical protein [Bdellovibrio sp.]
MMTPQILFQNSYVIVVQKPPCTLSVPARDQNDPRRVLGRELEIHLGSKVYPIHRLDFEVAGPMLFALDPQAHSEFCSAFESHAIQKTYHALGLRESDKTPPGLVLGKEDEWFSKLVRGKRRTFEAPHGKESFTLAKLLEERETKWGTLMLLELGPRTGRPHQLRFEMMKHNIPIVGDNLYGSSLKYDEESIALLATKLELSSQLSSKWHVPSVFTGPGPQWEKVRE